MKQKALLVFLLCFLTLLAIRPSPAMADYSGSVDIAGDAGQYSSIAIDPTGLPVISYFESTNGGRLRFARCSNAGCSGTATTRTLAGSGAGYHSSLAIGSDGFPVISYYDSFFSRLMVVKCNDATCLSSTNSIVDSTSGVGQYSSLAIGSDGFPVIAYFDTTVGNGTLKVAKCGNASCSTVAATSYPDANVTNNILGDFGISIAVRSDGVNTYFPIITYYDGTDQNLKMVRCGDAQCSQVTATVHTLDSTGDVGKYSDVVHSVNNKITVTYYDDTNDDVKIIRCLPTNCAAPTSFMVDGSKAAEPTINVGQYTSVAVGTDDKPIVSYYDVTASRLRVARCDNVNCSTATPKTILSNSAEGEYTSIAIRPSDQLPIISYFSSSLKDLRVTVEGNQLPVLDFIENKTIDEHQTLSFSAEATDADNNPLQGISYSMVNQPVGSIFDTSNGDFTWTPAENQQGVHTISITATDTLGGSGGQIFTVTVNEINEAPVLTIVSDNFTPVEGTAYTFDANATDPDLPAQALTYSLVKVDPSDPAILGTINPTTGVYTWTPTEAQGGMTQTFKVQVIDTFNPTTGRLTDVETVTLTVLESNLAPAIVAASINSTYTVNEHSLVTFDANATDADTPADTLTWSLSSLPPEMASATIDASTGVFNWTPAETDGGKSYDFNVVVNDNSTAINGPSTATKAVKINVTETNSVPSVAVGEITPNPVSESHVGNVTFTATGMDTDDPVQSLSYSLGAGAPEGASINSLGVFTWTFPREAQQEFYTFDVIVKDNGAGTLMGMEEVTIFVDEINTNPVVGAINVSSPVDEGDTVSFTATATDSDRPNQQLTFALVGNAPSNASLDPDTGAFSWTTDENDGGTSYSFQIEVSDVLAGSGLSAPINITVTETNSAPQITSITQTSPNSVDEGQTVTYVINATDTDIPVQTLTFSLTNAPEWASVAGNVLTLAIPVELSDDTISFNVVANDGQTNSSAFAFEATIGDENAAPVVTDIKDRTMLAGQKLEIQVDATDSDIPAQTLTYSISAPAGALINTSTGLIEWSSVPAGIHTLTVTVSDGTASTSDSFVVTVGIEMIENGGFELFKSGKPAVPTDWVAVFRSKEKRQCSGFGNNSDCGYEFVGSANEASVVSQVLSTTEVATLNSLRGLLVLKADVRPTNPKPETARTVLVKLIFTDGTKGKIKLVMPAGTAYVTNDATYVIPNKTVKKGKIIIRNLLKSGRFAIDNVSLMQIPNAARAAETKAQDGLLPLPPTN